MINIGDVVVYNKLLYSVFNIFDDGRISIQRNDGENKIKVVTENDIEKVMEFNNYKYDINDKVSLVSVDDIGKEHYLDSIIVDKCIGYDNTIMYQVQLLSDDNNKQWVCESELIKLMNIN